MDGLYCFHKPLGITSNDFLTDIKKNLRKRTGQRVKAGHGGTLDKYAEGALVVGIGNGTKQLTTHLRGNKVYQATGIMGVTTDTDDASGKILQKTEVDHPPSIDMIEDAITHLTGTILQHPPVYSAIKKDGKRLSDRARDGEVVIPDPRRVTIYSFEVMEYEWPKITIRVECSGGTYIRALIRDLGKAVGVGGHMSHLVRLRHGNFNLTNSISLADDDWFEKMKKQSELDYSSRTDRETTEFAKVLGNDIPVHRLSFP